MFGGLSWLWLVFPHVFPFIIIRRYRAIYYPPKIQAACRSGPSSQVLVHGRNEQEVSLSDFLHRRTHSETGFVPNLSAASAHSGYTNRDMSAIARNHRCRYDWCALAIAIVAIAALLIMLCHCALPSSMPRVLR